MSADLPLLTVEYNFPTEVDEEDFYAEEPFIRFRVAALVPPMAMTWEITGSTALNHLSTEWRHLLGNAPMDPNEAIVLAFGSEYGSHVDNGCVQIRRTGGYLRLLVDGARGGEMGCSLPIENCQQAIEAVADGMDQWVVRLGARRRTSANSHGALCAPQSAEAANPDPHGAIGVSSALPVPRSVIMPMPELRADLANGSAILRYS